MKYVFFVMLVIAFVPPVRRFFFWLLVGRQLVKQQKRANQHAEQQREGEIKVNNPRTNDDSRFKGGEYVDYEEIK